MSVAALLPRVHGIYSLVSDACTEWCLLIVYIYIFIILSSYILLLICIYEYTPLVCTYILVTSIHVFFTYHIIKHVYLHMSVCIHRMTSRDTVNHAARVPSIICVLHRACGQHNYPLSYLMQCQQKERTTHIHNKRTM